MSHDIERMRRKALAKFGRPFLLYNPATLTYGFQRMVHEHYLWNVARCRTQAQARRGDPRKAWLSSARSYIEDAKRKRTAFTGRLP